MFESDFETERYVFNENREPIGRTPILRISTPLGVLDMDYENTRIRTFGEGFKDLNHVQYTNPDGDAHGFFFESLEEGDLAKLEAANFPSNFDPIPPEEDIEWYDDIQLRAIGATLPDTEEELVFPSANSHIAVKVVKFALRQVTGTAGKLGIKL